MEGSGGQQHLAGDPNAFSQMVSQMLSPQNEQRRAAEALFGEAKKQGDFTATNLVGLLRQSQQVDARALCAVLLRKVGHHARRCVPKFHYKALGVCRQFDGLAGADKR